MTLEKKANQGNPEADGLWWCPECGNKTLEEVEEYFWLCKCGYNENEAGISEEEKRKEERKYKKHK